jgi:hypothetical protein
MENFYLKKIKELEDKNFENEKKIIEKNEIIDLQNKTIVDLKNNLEILFLNIENG